MSKCRALLSVLATSVLVAVTSGALAQTVADSLTQAVTPDGQFISWQEHLIDDEQINGGLPIRGGDGLTAVDLDRDGNLDIVSVHEDSNHLRIAFGTNNPDRWVLRTLAQGDIVGAVEDVAAGDLNGDGWPDLVFACEDAHLIYFQNPGASAREETWPHSIPAPSKGRGAWLRVFLADVTGDGKLDVLAANKGGQDIIDTAAGDPLQGTTSLFNVAGKPLDASAWREQVLWREGVPNNAMPIDVDGDGDIDILTASRLEGRSYIIENRGPTADGQVRIAVHEIAIEPDFSAAPDWSAGADAFNADFADFNGDARPDLVLVANERLGSEVLPRLGWLQQPASLHQPWRYHLIGHTLPDWIAGLVVADIDGDGDDDVMAGGYSGINILRRGYSGASRERDDPRVTRNDSVARISWFEQLGDGKWQRHDISRRVRGMYDAFLPLDMDGDGDLDFVATRGNSGGFDGVFWLEQRRSAGPQVAFTPARQHESRALPLPLDSWRAHYTQEHTSREPENR